MLLFSIVMLAAQQASSEPLQKDIVVIGTRLQRWQGTYQIRGSRMKCATKASTGDPQIDATGCTAFEVCANTLSTRIAASDDKSLAKAVRISMKETIKQDLSACVGDKRASLIAALAQRRLNEPAN